MDIVGEGKNPSRQYLLKLAKISDINQSEAIRIIDQVLEVASSLPCYLKD